MGSVLEFYAEYTDSVGKALIEGMAEGKTMPEIAHAADVPLDLLLRWIDKDDQSCIQEALEAVASGRRLYKMPKASRDIVKKAMTADLYDPVILPALYEAAHSAGAAKQSDLHIARTLGMSVNTLRIWARKYTEVRMCLEQAAAAAAATIEEEVVQHIVETPMGDKLNHNAAFGMLKVLDPKGHGGKVDTAGEVAAAMPKITLKIVQGNVNEQRREVEIEGEIIDASE